MSRRSHRWQTERRIKPDLRNSPAITGDSSRGWNDLLQDLSSSGGERMSTRDTFTASTTAPPAVVDYDDDDDDAANIVIEPRRYFNARSQGAVLVDETRMAVNYDNDDYDSDSSSTDDEQPGAYAVSREAAVPPSTLEWDPTEHEPVVDPLAEVSTQMTEENPPTNVNDAVVRISTRADVDAKLRPCKAWEERRCLIVLAFFVVLSCVAVVVTFVVISNSNTAPTTFTPIDVDCDFSGVPEDQLIDIALQCRCYNQVKRVPEKIASGYQTVIEDGDLESWLNSDVTIESCSLENVALLWVAADYVEAEASSETYLSERIRTRFALAFLSLAWDLENWNESANWMTAATECVWYGVDCDDENHVVSLLLPSNGLQGSLSSKLGLIPRLEALDLSVNDLFGPIPVELLTLSNLVSLNLTKSQLGGSIPNIDISQPIFPRLEELILLESSLTGLIPAWLEQVTSLKKLDLSVNYFTGSPPQLVRMSDLESIVLGKTALQGSIPESWGILQRLEVLKVNEIPNLDGEIPSSFQNLTNLKHLDLYTTLVRGMVLDILEHMSSLEFFVGSNTLINGTLPKALGLMTNLVALELSDTELSGTIPSELSNCSNLEYVTLYGTLVEGALPKELGSLSSLRTLNVGWTSITGTVPLEYANLSSLDMINIAGTKISDTLPSELCDLSSSPVIYVTGGAISDCSCCAGEPPPPAS